MTRRPRQASPRTRGRPKGSEIDDGVALASVADLLVQGETGNVAAAVRRFAGNDPSLIRRLQRKFRRDRQGLLAAARTRAEAKARERQTWLDEIRRVTQPFAWQAERDPAMRVMDALSLEQQDRLTKLISKPRG